jgi:hypothetical protein
MRVKIFLHMTSTTFIVPCVLMVEVKKASWYKRNYIEVYLFRWLKFSVCLFASWKNKNYVPIKLKNTILDKIGRYAKD